MIVTQLHLSVLISVVALVAAPTVHAAPTGGVPPAVEAETCQGPVQYAIGIGFDGRPCDGSGAQCSGGLILLVVAYGQWHQACQGTGDTCTGHGVVIVALVGQDNSACGTNNGHVCSYGQLAVVVLAGDGQEACAQGATMEVRS